MVLFSETLILPDFQCTMAYACGLCSQISLCLQSDSEPKRQGPRGKSPGQSLPYPYSFSEHSLSSRWFYCHNAPRNQKSTTLTSKTPAKVRRTTAEQKMAELLSAALIPCSPLRLSFLLSVPWAELHFYRNKFVPISQTQVKCSKSRNQAQFSIAACLWQLKWWLYLLMTV